VRFSASIEVASWQLVLQHSESGCAVTSAISETSSARRHWTEPVILSRVGGTGHRNYKAAPASTITKVVLTHRLLFKYGQ
jgi:hypothetical protein